MHPQKTSMDEMAMECRKKEFRIHCLKRLKKASIQGAYKKDKKVLESVYQLISKCNAKSVMLYIPLKIEVNVFPLIQRLRKEKRTVYVPFMEGKSFRLVKY